MLRQNKKVLTIVGCLILVACSTISVKQMTKAKVKIVKSKEAEESPCESPYAHICTKETLKNKETLINTIPVLIEKETSILTTNHIEQQNLYAIDLYTFLTTCQNTDLHLPAFKKIMNNAKHVLSKIKTKDQFFEKLAQNSYNGTGFVLFDLRPTGSIKPFSSFLSPRRFHSLDRHVNDFNSTRKHGEYEHEVLSSYGITTDKFTYTRLVEFFYNIEADLPAAQEIGYRLSSVTTLKKNKEYLKQFKNIGLDKLVSKYPQSKWIEDAIDNYSIKKYDDALKTFSLQELKDLYIFGTFRQYKHLILEKFTDNSTFKSQSINTICKMKAQQAYSNYFQNLASSSFEAELKHMANRLDRIYTSIISEYENVISKNFTPKTRKKLLKKLRSIKLILPTNDYTHIKSENLNMVPSDWIGNMAKALRSTKTKADSFYADPNSMCTQPTERNDLHYNMHCNSIFVPMYYLLPPFMSRKNGLGESYGGLGTSLAHEIAHALTLDANKKRFNALLYLFSRSEKNEIINNFMGVMPLFSDEDEDDEDTVVDEFKDKMPENLADYFGVQIAYRALTRQTKKDIEKRKFFDNYALQFCTKEQDESSLYLYSTNEIRTNIQTFMLKDYAKLMQCKADDQAVQVNKNHLLDIF